MLLIKNVYESIKTDLIFDGISRIERIYEPMGLRLKH